MENSWFVLAIASSLIYFFVKVLEVKLLKKNKEDLVSKFKDSIYFFFIILFSCYALDKFGVLLVRQYNHQSSPGAFTNKPDF